jgi:hypothetical protein
MVMNNLKEELISRAASVAGVAGGRGTRYTFDIINEAGTPSSYECYFYRGKVIQTP